VLDKRSKEGGRHNDLASGEPVTSGVDSVGNGGLSGPAAEVPMARIAFGDRPEAPIRISPADSAQRCWLAAVALGARGRYAAAAALLERVLGRAPGLPGASQALRAHAAVTRAAHLRQVGGHLAARRWDGLGLALATPAATAALATPASAAAALATAASATAVGDESPTTVGDEPPTTVVDEPATSVGDPRTTVGDPRAVGDPWAVAEAISAGSGGAGQPDPGLDRAAARVDALLGLAADAIGLADLELAERMLRAAQPAAAEHPSWRPGVRWHWVRAELALCRDRPAEAVELAGQALAAARTAGAVRHEIKSALVLAVAEVGAGQAPERAIAAFSALSERTRQSGLWTLEWPIQLQLASLMGAPDPVKAATHRSEVAQIVGAIRRHADPKARYVLDCSPWVPAAEETELLHLDPNHPPGTRRSPHSSRMECKNKP